MRPTLVYERASRRNPGPPSPSRPPQELVALGGEMPPFAGGSDPSYGAPHRGAAHRDPRLGPPRSRGALLGWRRGALGGPPPRALWPCRPAEGGSWPLLREPAILPFCLLEVSFYGGERDVEKVRAALALDMAPSTEETILHLSLPSKRSCEHVLIGSLPLQRAVTSAACTAYAFPSGSDRHTFYDVVRGSDGDDVVHLEPGLRK